MGNTRVYWLHTLSPTHTGVGRGVGYIDLPIDRDGVTGWPIIRGSSFKGVWADYHRATGDARRENSVLRAAFGIAGDGNNSNAGALVPTDAKLVCLPIRSFRGTFAWCTSALCLHMLKRTMSLAGEHDLPSVPSDTEDETARYAAPTALVERGKIYLEDLDFAARECEFASAWANKISRLVFPDDPVWQEQFIRRFVIVPDAAFDFLCETGTEVNARIRLEDETKTVANSALWNEESLPAETIFAGLIQCDRIFAHDGKEIAVSGLFKRFATDAITLQVGGKATIGRGQVRCIFANDTGGNG